MEIPSKTVHGAADACWTSVEHVRVNHPRQTSPGRSALLGGCGHGRVRTDWSRLPCF